MTPKAQCRACGKTISVRDAYASINVDGETVIVCCPMCMTALEAGEAQRRLLPQSFTNDRVTVFVEYLPALLVGGDYACIRSPVENKLHLLLADVSGHGVTSSLMVSRLSAEVERLLDADEPPSAVVRTLNDWIRGTAPDRRFYATVFHAVVDFEARTLIWLGCGHPAQLLWSAQSQRFLRLESQTIPLGLFDLEESAVPAESMLPIEPGDKLAMFTDGLPEQRIDDGTALDEAGVIRLLDMLVKEPTDHGRRRLQLELDRLRDRGAEDDILLVFLHIRKTGVPT